MKLEQIRAFRSIYYGILEGRALKFKRPVELRGKYWLHSRLAGRSYSTGKYEVLVQDRFRAFLKGGDIFWDVGAHVGFFSLFAASIVGTRGRVVSFEPVPGNADFIRKVHELNGAPSNWKIRNVAVASKPGIVCFKAGETSSTGKIDGNGDLKVEAVRADDEWNKAGREKVSFIKIDVEGAAGDVISGARNLLESCTPALFLEIHSADELKEVASALPQSYSQLALQAVSSHSWSHPTHVEVLRS